MNTKLFIADKIKVGFNLRSDTYTGKLAYVIGHDGKKWRKEPSWEGWRVKYITPEESQLLKVKQFNDNVEQQKKSHKYYVEQYTKNPTDSYYKRYAEMTELEYLTQTDLHDFDTWIKNERFQLGSVSDNESIKPVEYDNVPTEGFVLNKKAGGYSTGWNHRSTYCRVYDPRGFEFEISIPNLLFILQECNAYKGKGLEGSFVYAWDGKDLVLLPAHCDEYKQSSNFTKLQSGKVGVKDLLEGCTYKTKQMEELIYLGKFNWFSEYSSKEHVSVKKQYVFYKVEAPRYGSRFVPLSNLSSLVQKVTETPVDNYASLLDEFNGTEYSDTLNEISEETYEPQKTMSYYNYRDSLGTAVLPLGNNKYEIYEIEGNSNRSGYSYGYKSEIESYNLKLNRIVSLKNNGDFQVKSTTPKRLERISYKSLMDMNLKKLKRNKNNKKQEIIF